jgi:hypothetical protein
MSETEYRFRWRGREVFIGPWLPLSQEQDHLFTRYDPEPAPNERHLWPSWDRPLVESEIAGLEERSGLDEEEASRLAVLRKLMRRLDYLRGRISSTTPAP